MAKQTKAQKTKKVKNRRMRRTVMGTLSAVFMLSAIIVALIPTPKLEAESSIDELAGVLPGASSDPDQHIPDYTDTTRYPIFSDFDGKFRVAYGPRKTTQGSTGTIVYYDKSRRSDGGILEIPAEMGAYLWDSGFGNGGEYIAVSNASMPLYYISQERVETSYKRDELGNPVFDENGNAVVETEGQNQILTLCTGSNTDQWQGAQLYTMENTPRDQYEFADGNTFPTPAGAEQLIIPIEYIGSIPYYISGGVVSFGAPEGSYGTVAAEGEGIFEGANNISTLIIPSETIQAIGVRAFAGCQIQAVKLGNAINSIGRAAFQNCNMLTSVEFAEPGNLAEIGDSAFEGCTSLGSLTIPGQVERLGSFCFKDCDSLTAIGLNGADDSGATTKMHTIGNGVFYNCPSLTQLSLPDTINNMDQVHQTCYGCTSLRTLKLPKTSAGTLAADNVRGCFMLDCVKCPSASLAFEEDHAPGSDCGLNCAFGALNLGYHTANESKYEVSDAFFVDGVKPSEAYNYCSRHSYAIAYNDPKLGGTVYEKTVDDYAFGVNENNELVNFEKINPTGSGRDVVIPDNIGPKYVTNISSVTFGNADPERANQEIAFVYIPASVRTIEPNAFLNCASLRTVYFDDVSAVESIGNDAFKINVAKKEGDADVDGAPYKGLNFIGDIRQDSVPYQFAMNPDNAFNASSVPVQYIGFCSTFPKNLQIKLLAEKDPDTNQVTGTTPTLVGIPTEDQIRNNNYSLSTYGGNSKYLLNRTEENTEALAALNEYYGNNNSTEGLSQLHEDIINSVIYLDIPAGVNAFAPDLFNGGKCKNVQSITMATVKEIPENAFVGCEKLRTFVMGSSGAPEGESLGDYAFTDCDSLAAVSLPATLSSFGKLPFNDCDLLTHVNFNQNPKYVCDNSIIYETDEAGNKIKLLECLKTRGNSAFDSDPNVRADEMLGVSEIAPQAFLNCVDVSSVDLSKTMVREIPAQAFDGATSMYSCVLPASLATIWDYAYRNTQLKSMEIPDNVRTIKDNAFMTGVPYGNIAPETVPNYVTAYIQGLTLSGSEKTGVKEYCVGKPGITYAELITHEVIFYDQDDNKLATASFKHNAQLIFPEDKQLPSKEGYVFGFWREEGSEVPVTNVTKDLKLYPRFYLSDDGTVPGGEGNEPGGEGTAAPDGTVRHTVTFVNFDGTIIDTQSVAEGSTPKVCPVVPTRKGYTFTTWSPSNYMEIPVMSDLTVTAKFQKSSSTGSTDSGSGGGKVDSDVSKQPSSGGGSNSGGGSSAGSQPAASAAPGSTTVKGTPAPANSAAARRPGYSSVSGNAVAGTRVPTTAGQPSTRVEVTKSGISNRDLVTAAVAGSNDNFVVKITDSDTARAAVEQAMLAEYGSLDDIKFFAMDISLYDSTGTTKIENTNGISVTITMPLPDVLAGYAGNNKAGAVKNGAFEKLGSRLITIDNVPCISFVATHFSPYAIYVETNHLTASDVSDVTPKTGDPIHPKWFLAIGLAFMSILMFLGKGSNNKIVKVIE